MHCKLIPRSTSSSVTVRRRLEAAVSRRDFSCFSCHTWSVRRWAGRWWRWWVTYFDIAVHSVGLLNTRVRQFRFWKMMLWDSTSGLNPPLSSSAWEPPSHWPFRQITLRITELNSPHLSPVWTVWCLTGRISAILNVCKSQDILLPPSFRWLSITSLLEDCCLQGIIWELRERTL